MYTFEERMKAVQLYIESDFSEETVISELGYPSYSALRYWYSEYKQNGKLHRSSAPKPYYTEAQKARAVEYFSAH